MPSLTLDKFAASMKESFDSLTLAMQNGFNGIQKELTDVKGDVSTLKGDIGTLKGDVSTLKKDVKELKEGQEKLTLQFKTLEYGQENILLRLDQKLNKIDYTK